MHDSRRYSQFDGNLHVGFSWEASDYLGKDHWLLTKSCTYYVGHPDSDVWVTVPKGFLSDGASVPGFVSGLIPRMGRLSQASILHDYLCETYEVTMLIDGVEEQVAIDRKYVDRIFYEALAVSQVVRWRIFLIKLGTSLLRLTRHPTKPRVDMRKKRMEALLGVL